MSFGFPQVDKFEGKKFMLIHGNADDNVHYQQSMLLARALERKDIMFQQMVSIIFQFFVDRLVLLT